jgi:hypothetical protein
VSKAVLRNLDLSVVFQAALIAAKNVDWVGPVIALGSIASYFDAAKLQQRRIQRAKISSLKAIRSVADVCSRTNLFCDVHFYLISWTRIYKLAQFILETSRFARTGRVIRRFRPDLEGRVRARDHCEHLEERLPGGKNQHKLLEQNDLLNMVNNHLAFGGKRVDVGPDSVRLLRRIIDEFRAALLFDSIESLHKDDPERLAFLLNQANSKAHIARIIKSVQMPAETQETTMG